MIFRLLQTKQKHVSAILALALSFSILLDWRQDNINRKSHKMSSFKYSFGNNITKLILWKILGFWQTVRIFRELKTVKTSNEMPNWRRQINKIDRQYSPQIRAFLKGTTSPKLILMLEMGSIWSNLHHIAGGIYNFYKDLC